MIFWLIPIIAIGLFLYLFFTVGDFCYCFLMSILSALATFVLCAVVAGSIEANADIEYRKEESHEICALADNAQFSQKISGTVFLVEARTKASLKYSYMYHEDKKGYAINEVDAQHCYINYTNDTPKVDIYYPHFTNSFLEWFIGGSIIADKEYIFYLPHDAQIINNYIINFE